MGSANRNADVLLPFARACHGAKASQLAPRVRWYYLATKKKGGAMEAKEPFTQKIANQIDINASQATATNPGGHNTT